ncbi:hypothetical protein POSPLADRAFT_1037374 [Postia placenta MAD-698-R-SB12]|uniref:Uncharacterized protein n=1 Tax=Postia placenta MAD-698-R-SB12 TaxID=670580 RepID=A0A1X6MKV3_9APHY|nr:hypothetical protein POSPLADRAFT_1037374 [Postia placenta MAD-698-R-SB12]OSX56673.1 hypothetical protein POSPLADRAFT_1037374 [Postia placenta MAD-698-R-SB12]
MSVSSEGTGSARVRKASIAIRGGEDDLVMKAGVKAQASEIQIQRDVTDSGPICPYSCPLLNSPGSTLLWYWSRIPTYPIDFWGIRDDGYTVGWASSGLICDVHSPYHVFEIKGFPASLAHHGRCLIAKKNEFTEWVRKRSCNRARRAGAAASRVKVDRDLLGLLSRDGVRDDEEGVHCRWRGWCAIVQRLVAKDVVAWRWARQLGMLALALLSPRIREPKQCARYWAEDLEIPPRIDLSGSAVPEPRYPEASFLAWQNRNQSFTDSGRNVAQSSFNVARRASH